MEIGAKIDWHGLIPCDTFWKPLGMDKVELIVLKVY